MPNFGAFPGRSSARFVSQEFPVALNGSTSVTHGLGRTPRFTKAVLVCKKPDATSWNVGDEIDVSFITEITNDAGWATVGANAAEVVVAFNGFTPALIPRDGGNLQLMTVANWNFKVYAEL